MRLYHCPQTRSTRILWLLEELNARPKVETILVSIQRSDGSGSKDPKNPHPEGKVPLLELNGSLIRESGAIVQYLADIFPAANLAPTIDSEQRAEYLAWLHYYGGVMEPVLTVHFSTMTPDELFINAFRGMNELSDCLTKQLSETPYLLGSSFSAADLLIVAPFIWFPALAPKTQPVGDWIDRCAARPAFKKVTEEDLARID